MTTSATRPWSERQREALRAFSRQATVRAQKEAEIQTRFAQQAKVVEHEFAETQKRLEEEFHETKEQLQQAFENTREELIAHYQQQVKQSSDDFYNRKEEVRGEYASAKEGLVQEFKESRWTTQTLFEADKKVAKDEMTTTIYRARKAVELIILERKEGYQLLKGWKVLEETPEPFTAKTPPGADPWKAIEACGLVTGHGLNRLRKMRLPGYIRAVWPYLFLVFIWAVATAPAYFVNEWYWWVLATTVTIIPIGLWARGKLIAWMEERTLNIFEGMHQAVADARAMLGAVRPA